MKTYLFTYLFAALAAVVITPVLILLARRLNVVDSPDARKVHSKPIPRIGGLAIFLSSTILVIAALFLNNTVGEAFRSKQLQIVVLLISGTFIFLVGLLDDLRGLRARYKLLAQITAALAVSVAGVRIESLNIPNLLTINLGWLSLPVTIFWIIAITNAVNLIDGLDGLAAGISAITCGVIAVFAFQSGQPLMMVLMLALLGSLSGFLFFNFNPARIFMGDCGSMFVGFILASSSVMCTVKSGTIVGLALPALALGLPIFDTIFSMLRRYLGRWGIASPDRSHLHHRLLNMGLRHRHVVIIMYAITVLAAGFGMFMMIVRGGSMVTVFICVLLLLVLVFHITGAVRLRTVISQVKSNIVIARQTKEYMDIFKDTYLRFHEVSSFKGLWQVVSDAAEDMGFLEISLTATARSGRSHKFIWRPAKLPPQEIELVTMKLVINENRFGMPLDVEVKIPAEGSLESAGRRIMLFGRLIDEYSLKDISRRKTPRPVQEFEPSQSAFETSETNAPVVTAENR